MGRRAQSATGTRPGAKICFLRQLYVNLSLVRVELTTP